MPDVSYLYGRVPLGEICHVVVNDHAGCRRGLHLDDQRFTSEQVGRSPYLMFCLSCAKRYPRSEVSR